MKKPIKITDQELKYILGKDFEFFKQKIVNNVYCWHCSNGNSTIVAYEIFLERSGDTILRGLCKKCGNQVARYMETGEVFDYQERIKKVREKYKI